MALSQAEAEFLLNHLFMPPKLPDKSDNEVGATKLLTLFATAAQNYGKELDLETQSDWMPIAKSISKWRDVYQQGEACEQFLEDTIQTMEEKSNLLLLLGAQNCAFLATRLKSSYKFEAWEVSARQEDVLTAKDCLQRQYPALAIELPLSTVLDPDFIHQLAVQLSSLARETFVPLSMEKVFKAATEIEESRQSRNPRLVTQWFFTALASFGHPCKTEAITKRTRDEVNWDNALLPWRRSSIWSCMKVALQLVIQNSPLGDCEQKHYKHFMLYFLSYIADRLLSSKLFFEYLPVLRTKVAKRANKLDPDVPGFLFVKYSTVIKYINEVMQRHWNDSKLLESRQLPIVRIGKPSLELRLPKTGDHLRKVLCQHADVSAQLSPAHAPQPSVAVSLLCDQLPKGNIFDFSHQAQSENEKIAAIRRRKETLVVFQSWVAKHLSTWLARTQPSANVCFQLRTLIEKFWESSRACFAPYAELMSGVLLTILELWMALDSITIKLCPLLQDYSPEMHKPMCKPLLLRKHSELARLRQVESYLDNRVKTAQHGSIFDPLSTTSLTVRLYDRSQKLQQLMDTIETQGEQQKEEHRAKFESLRNDYERAMMRLNDSECKYEFVKEGRDIGSSMHNYKGCWRCRTKTWTKKVDIERYEEILPESLPMRKALVYELQPDEEIVIYRDCLFFILRDILECDLTKTTSKLYSVHDFEPLQVFAHPLGRIGLASFVKPHSKTHRHLIRITTSVDTIFHPHTMVWTTADLLHGTSVLPKSFESGLAHSKSQSDATRHKGYNLSLARLVRTQFGASPYAQLIDTVRTAGIPQNNVIARQSTCPADIHVSEWCAFGSMRYGSNIQLTNLLRSLLSKDCDLSSSATVLLFEQILHEAGSATGASPGVLRAADIDLHKPTFINRILQYVSDTIIAISENWKEHVTAWTLSLLTRKLLSLNKNRDPHVRTRCLQLIRAIRKIGLQWLERLTDLHSTQRKEEISSASAAETRRRILEAGLLCVDDDLVPELFATNADFADIIAVSVYIHDYSKFFEKTTDKWLELCLSRDLVLQVKLEATIKDAMENTPDVLALGLRIVWPQADPGPLMAVRASEDRWYQAEHAQSGLLIHYNIATGSLLVGGKPLSVLPEQYTQQEVYKQVLGDRLSNVVASDDPKMEYMTVSTVNGYQLYFGFHGTPPVLQIHAKKDGLHYIAILRSRFGGDLPEQIVQSSIPWLCINASCIEFRNMHQPWHPEKSNWKVSAVSMKDSQYQMESKDSFLIDNHTGIGLTICSVLSSLELSKHIHISFLKAEKKLAIALPRYSLNFEVDRHGQLQCRELAAFVRPLQELGTFYGLKNRLVLQDKGSTSSNPTTWVLVPFGEVTVKSAQPHVSVDIDVEDFHRMKFYKYRVDKTLHCLIADQVEGHLWKAYLHACTSYCLPDELTGRTGVEESFRTLDDHWLQTCVPFSVEAQQMLERIARLSVYRSFYPDNKTRRMQKTIWNDGLSFMFQHDRFHLKVREITFHNHKAQFLHKGVEYVIPEYRGNDQDFVLAERAMYTWQKYWPTVLVSNEDKPRCDKPYSCRDRTMSQDTSAVFEIATEISSWNISAWSRCNFYDLLEKFQREASPNGSLEPLIFSTAFIPTSLTQLLTLDMKTSWAYLLRYCLEVKESDKAELLFTMTMILFGNPKLLESIKTLLPFAVLPGLKAIGLPNKKTSGNIFGGSVDWDRYDLAQGESIDWDVIEKILHECRAKDVAQRGNVLPQHDGPAEVQAPEDNKIHAQKKLIKQAVSAAWNTKQLDLPKANVLTKFDTKLLHAMLIGRLGIWTKNKLLRNKCEEWEDILESYVGQAKPLPRPDFRVPASSVRELPCVVRHQSLLQVMQKSSADGLLNTDAEFIGFDGSIEGILALKYDDSNSGEVEAAHLQKELEELIRAEVGTQDKTSADYRKGLLKSVAALKENGQQSNAKPEFPIRSVLQDRLDKIESSTTALLDAINMRLKPCDPGQEALKLAGLWPTATALGLLELMAKSHRELLPKEWGELLIMFARGLCGLQRIRRILRFREADDRFGFGREVENAAHDYWNPGLNREELGRDMDWLLFEIQNDMLIRPIQVLVAKEMIKPESGVLQLQMGDGKSSVILPLYCMSVAASMDKLVRVVVLKALAKEAMASLSKALSGLVQTAVYWLPFSRATKVTENTATEFRNLWNECRATRGILLTLPEHLNSFRLIGNDQLIAERLGIAQKLLAAQKFLDNNARDIIDESDEVLKPAYELVYTNGAPKPLSGAPYRWEILLLILDVVQACAKAVHLGLPHGLEYKANGKGAFAFVRILTAEAKDVLLEAVLKAILAGAIPTLSFSSNTIHAVSDFIRLLEVGDDVHKIMKQHLQNEQESVAIHLLRGLFAYEFLAAALEKRFFVNYGLDRSRCMSAVPYRSKGVPSTAAEFAQPEMSILLTILSHHYVGLEKHDMRRILTIMLRLPDPSNEWSCWVAGSDVSERIRNVASINLQDDDCVAEIHKSLFKCKRVVNFFLRTVVLPAESKEYEKKLSSSAWDLCAGGDGKITGGFSGTCDSFLCKTMERKEIDKLLHFDAAVLISLLSERNRRYVKANSAAGKVLDTSALLQLIEKEAPNTSVIIDVGAQTLDKNQDVAEMWLKMRRESSNPNTKLAAVFFDEQDEKQVITQDGNVVPWQSSPYKEQPSLLLYLLDQHHTRGVNFSLPDDFAAALLLGPKLPKDSLVQAVMRLRKLSESQSIVTFAPLEVDNDIRMLLSKRPQDTIDIADVIKWAMKQSCDALRAQKTLRIIRHLEWSKRDKAFNRVGKDGTIQNSPIYKRNVLQSEVNKVEDLYPADTNSLLRLPEFSEKEMQDKTILEYLEEKDGLANNQAYLDQFREREQEQEQEREQQHEREAEREVERPKAMYPKIPDVNQHLGEIILRDQSVDKLPDGVLPAFELLSRTSLYESPLWKRFSGLLVATKDHLDTVKSDTGRDQDDFLRPVHWLLKLRLVRELILIGPHEAQVWTPLIRRSKNVTLISYAPKTTRDMVSFDDLDVYTIPERAVPVPVDADVLTLLRLFAGQLYFNNFEEYERFCRLLSIRCGPEPPGQSGERGERRSKMLKLVTKQKHELVPIVKKFTDMRRKGVEWAFTDVGRVLNGEILSVDHFK